MKRACVLFALCSTVVLGDEAAPSAAERLGFKYNPVKESVSPPAAEVPVPDGTVVMPKFLVRESRVKPTEEELLTPSEKLAAAKKENISPLYAVTFGPLSQLAGYYLNFLSILGGWHPNDAEALVLYEQNVRVRKMNEFDDMVAMVKLADQKEAADLQAMRSVLFRLPQESDDTPLSVITAQRGRAKSHP
jgi:hypothetical protein